MKKGLYLFLEVIDALPLMMLTFVCIVLMYISVLWVQGDPAPLRTLVNLVFG